MRRLPPTAALGILALLGASAQANTSTFIATGQGKAVITTGTNSVTITLTDLYVNPNSVADNMSAFTFTLSSAPTSVALASGSAQEVTVAGGGGYTLGSTVTPGWVPTLVSATTTLDDLVGTGHAGPAETIIGAPGSGSYSGANASIAGNGPHNPFLYETATFTLTEAGVTAATNITSTMFQFGTTDGTNTTTVTNGTATPEPSTLAMLGGAVFLMVLSKLRRRQSETPDR